MTRHRSFSEFWPSYLRDHAQPATRRLHYAGTALVLLIAVAGILARDWRLLLALPVAGYGFAWFAHAVVERNRPATFTYPLWSLAADFRMSWLWATRRLDRELEAAGARSDRPEGVRDGI
ncbi:MAG: Mpo1-like protein [Allosphingosinicella sp.]